MRGVVFLGGRKLELREFPDPKPGPGEVVVAMKASGMCGSDLHPYRAVGNAAAALGLGGTGGPVVAGHEPCGVVAARGPGVADADAPTGQRVMVHHYKGCGRCKHCREGIVVYGMTGHGGHAPFMTVPAFTLVPLPESLTFEEGAAISCGTGTAYGALKRLDVSGRDTLAVFGQGPVGLSATLLGRAMGARVIAIDVAPERLALAREFGAETVVNAKETDPVAALRQLTIHASWTFSSVGQAECARFIADRRVGLGRLLTHRFRLEQAEDAYRLFDTQTTGKGVFTFN